MQTTRSQLNNFSLKFDKLDNFKLKSLKNMEFRFKSQNSASILCLQLIFFIKTIKFKVR